jgi:hypothetical protein
MPVICEYVLPRCQGRVGYDDQITHFDSVHIQLPNYANNYLDYLQKSDGTGATAVRASHTEYTESNAPGLPVPFFFYLQ